MNSDHCRLTTSKTLQDRDVMLDDVAPPIKAAMYSRNIDPATPGLISNLLAQVALLTCFSFEYSTTLLLEIPGDKSNQLLDS
jgi:hypothetical protein